MFFGLEDLSPDLFFEVDDTKIQIHLKDILGIPELSNLLPMGSFGTDGKIKFLDLKLDTRIEVGKKFLIRDDYAVKKFGEVFILRDVLLQEFNSIPKLVNILKKVGSKLSEINVKDFEITDLYYIIVLYFSSNYRESSLSKQTSKEYQLLTDINMELNHFQMITKVSDFFFYVFQNYLATTPGETPFMCEFGTTLKSVIQSKNTVVQRVRVENELNYFINEFNSIYTGAIKVNDIRIDNNVNQDGGDSWIVHVDVYIENEFISFQILTNA